MANSKNARFEQPTSQESDRERRESLQPNSEENVAEEQLDRTVGGQSSQKSLLADIENQTIDDIPAGAKENSIQKTRLDNLDARGK